MIHSTAIIEENVLIGSGTKVWHWVHICQDAKIGENCILGQNVYIGPGVTIGNNVKIQNNVSIYKGVELKSNVFCGPSCVFTNVLNPRSKFEKKNDFKKTIVNEHVTIGANATIVCGINLGFGSFIGAGSVQTKSTKKYSLNYGNPSKQKGWVNLFGEKIKFDNNNEYYCKVSKKTYILSNQTVIVR